MGDSFRNLLAFIHPPKLIWKENERKKCLQKFMKLIIKLFKLCLWIIVKIKSMSSGNCWVIHRRQFSRSTHFWLALVSVHLKSDNFMIPIYASPQFRASSNGVAWALIFSFLNPRAYNMEVISLYFNPGIRRDKCLVHLHLSCCGIPLKFLTLLSAGPSTSSRSSFMLCDTIGYSGCVCK